MKGFKLWLEITLAFVSLIGFETKAQVNASSPCDSVIKFDSASVIVLLGELWRDGDWDNMTRLGNCVQRSDMFNADLNTFLSRSIGEAYRRKGQLDKAIAYFDSVQQVLPDSSGYQRFMMHRCRVENKEYRLALKDSELGLEAVINRVEEFGATNELAEVASGFNWLIGVCLLELGEDGFCDHLVRAYAYNIENTAQLLSEHCDDFMQENVIKDE
jgi:tetratricopeptide (TPR) repeat protein